MFGRSKSPVTTARALLVDPVFALPESQDGVALPPSVSGLFVDYNPAAWVRTPDADADLVTWVDEHLDAYASHLALATHDATPSRTSPPGSTPPSPGSPRPTGAPRRGLLVARLRPHQTAVAQHRRCHRIHRLLVADPSGSDPGPTLDAFLTMSDLPLWGAPPKVAWSPTKSERRAMRFAYDSLTLQLATKPDAR